VNLLAGYAALVGTAGLAWQIAASVRASRTRLRLTVASTWSFDAPPTADGHMVSITVTNLSRHDVQMPGIEVFQPSIARGWPIREIDVLDESIRVLPARSSHCLKVRMDRFVGIEPGNPVIATAIAATGERFRSKPSVLGSISTSSPQRSDCH
jgi:hypothetical protein